MISFLFTSFLWFGLTYSKLTRLINDAHLKVASMCISRQLGETQCYDAINEITNLKFKLAVSEKSDDRKNIKNELDHIISKYGIR